MVADNFEIERLLQQVHNEPNRGDIRYLLGARWASAGRYDLAVEEMSRAIELDPMLNTARLQLGLLHLTSGRPAEAVAAWRGLERLSDSDPLRLFARGLEALLRDDFAVCVQWLEMGIRANHSNEPLNRDMALVIDRVRQTTRPDSPTQPQDDDGSVRTDFSLYDGSKKN
jgi:tetratricopeptide (TPR) repeat protein